MGIRSSPQTEIPYPPHKRRTTTLGTLEVIVQSSTCPFHIYCNFEKKIWISVFRILEQGGFSRHPDLYDSRFQRVGFSIATVLLTCQLQWGSEIRPFKIGTFWSSDFKWSLLFSSYPKEAKQLLNGCWIVPPSKWRRNKAQIWAVLPEGQAEKSP